MPELPEVETIKNTLNRFVCDRTIKDIIVYWPNIIKHPDDVEEFKHQLIVQTIQKVARIGKYLLIELDDYNLVSHLRMEGKYSVLSQDIPYTKDTLIIFQLTNFEVFSYKDVRFIGIMYVL